MSDVSVEIFQDQSSPLGGYAVIRFNGLWLLPPNATFTIEPVDEKMHAAPQDGWPAGKRRPLETRVTSKGIEILVGPEIVDAPLLLPGTPVAISVPEASVRVEARWPNLPVSRKVRGDPVVVSAEQLLTEVAALERARFVARQVVPPTVALKPYMNGSADGHAAGPTSPPEPSATVAPPADPLTTALREAARKVDAPATGAIPTTSRADASSSKPPQLPALIVKTSAVTAARSPVLAFAAGFVAAIFLSGILWYALRPSGSAAVPVVTNKLADRQSVAPSAPLHTVFGAGSTSPRGRSAESVELPTALMLADQNLHAMPGGADREEAAFWLRKALSKALGGAQLGWALTQLGSIYAERSSGTPDYQTAKTLWEIAAAHGDPIALCFLASLHENGLDGMPPSKKAALGYYGRAKELGGCPGLDQSLVRLTE